MSTGHQKSWINTWTGCLCLCVQCICVCVCMCVLVCSTACLSLLTRHKQSLLNKNKQRLVAMRRGWMGGLRALQSADCTTTWMTSDNNQPRQPPYDLSARPPGDPQWLLVVEEVEEDQQKLLYNVKHKRSTKLRHSCTVWVASNLMSTVMM